jgi:hypothetical protein
MTSTWKFSYSYLKKSNTQKMISLLRCRNSKKKLKTMLSKSENLRKGKRNSKKKLKLKRRKESENSKGKPKSNKKEYSINTLAK